MEDETYTEMLENARRGAGLLDREEPGWRRRINRTVLVMDSTQKCIIAQTFGSWYLGTERLGISFDRDAQVRYGFDLDEEQYEMYCFGELMEMLADAWQEVLAEQDSRD